ncbi:unnamed protein product, partial [Rotaria sp. Silwood1]
MRRQDWLEKEIMLGMVG